VVLVEQVLVVLAVQDAAQQLEVRLVETRRRAAGGQAVDFVCFFD